MGRASSKIWEEEKYVLDIGGKPEAKRPVGRPKRRWVDGIKMELREII
jgi:hypothetical protein